MIQLFAHYDAMQLPLDHVMGHYFRNHKAIGSKDRRYIADMACNVVRYRGALDRLIQGNPTWEKRYETFLERESELDQLPIRDSFPNELFELFAQDYGEKDAEALCRVCNTQAPATIRINRLKIDRASWLNRYDHDVEPCPFSSDGVRFKKRTNYFTLEGFKEGEFEVQDEGSQIAASLIQANPGDHVLDYCAGAGGKALAIAPAMENRGQLYLYDIREGALAQAKQRLKRAGVQNAQVRPSIPKKLKGAMDWVVVDAPCSGTGTLRRNPDMKWRFNLDSWNKVLGEQRSIFEKALSYVKKGGYIAYITCSVLKAENESQVEHFLRTYPVKLVGMPFKTLPQKGGMDGFFAALFVRQ